MPSPEGEAAPTPSMGPTDEAIQALFKVVAGRVKGRDPDYGYEYKLSVVKPLAEIGRLIQMRHGLNRSEVMDMVMSASELEVLVQEHVAPRLLDNPEVTYN